MSVWVQPRFIGEGYVEIFQESSGNVYMSKAKQISQPLNFVEKWKSNIIYTNLVETAMKIKPFYFDPQKDVLVMLHIQKTGGSSFGRLLALEIANFTCTKIESGRKQFDCSIPLSDSFHNRRVIWLFSRFSVGWACGLHADYTELKDCVDGVLNGRETFNRTRRYHYITILREPISRYISEWRHIARGATWAGAELRCNGRQATMSEVPFCYEGSNWRGVALSDFIECEHNLAHNRQTRMLSDLRLVNCYNKTGMDASKRSEKMLISALTNLAKFSFIGLSENHALTQWLFEHTFINLKFNVNMTQKKTKADRYLPTLTSSDIEHIRNVNMLDLVVYDFAKTVFYKRVATFGNSAEIFHQQNSYTFNDDSSDNSEYDPTNY